jgi:hypothetical protein
MWGVEDSSYKGRHFISGEVPAVLLFGRYAIVSCASHSHALNTHEYFSIRLEGEAVYGPP